MNTNVLSLIFGLATFASLGAYYLSNNNKIQVVPDFQIMRPDSYSYLDSTELNYRINLFKDWMVVNDKQYSTSEAAVRFDAWNKNYEYVQDHNSKNLSWTVEMNKFADLLSEEFGSLYLGYNAHHYDQVHEAQNIKILDESNLEADVDWRAKGAVTKVKNQQSCGSCYAFASGAGVEGAFYIKNKVLKALSPQQLVDCSGGQGNQGCNGGLMTNSYTYIKSQGIESNKNYPYANAKQSCKYESSKVFTRISGHVNVQPNSYTQLQVAVAKQPVAVAVQADQSAFQLYKSGIIASGCGVGLNHAILAVGYSGSSYWIVKNSWGPEWGDKGYAKIAMGSQNSGRGVCGINMQNTYPTL